MKQTSEALVLVLENVDRLFDEMTIAEEVFRLVRAFHEKARTSKPWRKLRQVLTYSTEPLAKLDFANAHYSPFNVGEEIALDEAVAFALSRLGLVSWERDRRVRPRCRLYRDRFIPNL
ncbi:MAG: AAA-like domain-containing protein [Geitlerinemataceae cyanobacterium]